jgi:uncharacterized membrane protein
MPAAVIECLQVHTGRRRRLTVAISLVAAAGVALSGFSLYHHFGTSKTSFCDLGQAFNCDIVNRSLYSTVLGVPVALIGVLGYLLIFLLATIYRSKTEMPIILVLASMGGLAFSLYLTYIEKFVLATWCILCLTSLALIGAEAVLSAVLLANRKM